MIITVNFKNVINFPLSTTHSYFTRHNLFSKMKTLSETEKVIIFFYSEITLQRRK